MTFAVLRALHTIVGEALDDIERVYHSHGQDTATIYSDVAVVHNNCIGDQDRELSANISPHSSPRSSAAYAFSATKGHNAKATATPRATGRHRSSLSSSSMNLMCKAYVSPPPSPCVTTKEHIFEQKMFPRSPTAARLSYGPPPLDFPALDAPFDATSPSETLTSNPVVMSAINRIISACGQMTATVQTPFLTICDSTMGYHLPSCMRIVEAAHVVEIIREHGTPGLHVQRISQLCGIDASKLAHILRLLATHHIFREVSPDTFALNRIASLIDSDKSIDQLLEYESLGQPELKYQGTNGIAAFVGLCSDEINKASAYMAETYLLSSSPRIREATQPTLAPFCFAFGAVDRNVDYFGWLEGQNDQLAHEARTEQGHGSDYAPASGLPDPAQRAVDMPSAERSEGRPKTNLSRFRLERFGKAMSGTGSWEAPGAVFNGFDWASLPRGSIVVDVGGGIGSTSMLLATAFSPPTGTQDLGLKFVIQDRAVVVDMGEKAWREKCPGLLDSGIARFQVHDFFEPQPIKNASVFLLRVVMHDWPDAHACRILLHLREAATPETKLLLGDFVLPLACADDLTFESGLEDVEGAQSVLAPAPLLPNLGKASANAYWMDLTMNVMFNSRERTLREIVALALSAGWKVVKVTQAPGSLFGYIVAVPIPRPQASQGYVGDMDTHRDTDGFDHQKGNGVEVLEQISRSGSPTQECKTPELNSVKDVLAKFGGGVKRYRGPGMIGRGLSSSASSINSSEPCSEGKDKEKEGDDATEKKSGTISAGDADRRRTTSTSVLNGSSSSILPSPQIAKRRSAFDVRTSFRTAAAPGDGIASSLWFPTTPSRTSSSSSVSSSPPAFHLMPSTSRTSSPATITTTAALPAAIAFTPIQMKRCSSPCPINLQIANAPRTAPPPMPPKSMRRPSSLANLRAARDKAFAQSFSPAGEPPSVPVPPLPTFSQGSASVGLEMQPSVLTKEEAAAASDSTLSLPPSPTAKVEIKLSETTREPVSNTLKITRNGSCGKEEGASPRSPPPSRLPSRPRTSSGQANAIEGKSISESRVGTGRFVSTTSSRSSSPASPLLSTQRPPQLRARASYAHISSASPSKGVSYVQANSVGASNLPAPSRSSPLPTTHIPVSSPKVSTSVHYGSAPRGVLQRGHTPSETQKSQVGLEQHGASVCVNVGSTTTEAEAKLPGYVNGTSKAVMTTTTTSTITTKTKTTTAMATTVTAPTIKAKVDFKSGFGFGRVPGRRASSATLSTSYKTFGGSTTDVGGDVGLRNGGIGGMPVNASPKAVRVLGPSGYGFPGRSLGGERAGGVVGFVRGAGQRLGGILRFDHAKGEEMRAIKEREREREKKEREKEEETVVHVGGVGRTYGIKRVSVPSSLEESARVKDTGKGSVPS